MHILFLCQYFPPEIGAPAARCFELARRWVVSGHKVSVVCGIPNHPTGQLYPGYTRRPHLHECIDGIDVHRVWVFVTPNAHTAKRALNFASFFTSSVVMSERLSGVDVVVATSPQFLTGIAGVLVKRLKRIPLVLEVRDLWPDSIEAVETGTPATAIRLLRLLERRMYRAADRIVIVSDGFRAHIRESGVSEDRIDTITNGVNRRLFNPEQIGRVVLNGELSRKFLVTYAGTIGLAHGLEMILAAAKKLRDHDNIHFVLVGEGAKKSELTEAAANTANVTILDRQSRETVATILKESDAALVLLRDQPIFRTVIPSKLFEAMGCGKPVILGVSGEAESIVRRADAGICIEPGSIDELSDAVLQLYRNPTEAKRLGRNGAEHAAANYDLDAIAQKYLAVLMKVAA